MDTDTDPCLKDAIDILKAQVVAQPQPAPLRNGGRRVLDQVVADLQARAEFGKEKYGTYLEVHNGRDPLWDAYQEALDLCMYLRQELMRREEMVTNPIGILDPWIELLRKRFPELEKEFALFYECDREKLFFFFPPSTKMDIKSDKFLLLHLFRWHQTPQGRFFWDEQFTARFPDD